MASARDALAMMEAAIVHSSVALVVLNRQGEIAAISPSAAVLLAGGASAILPRVLLDSVVARVASSNEVWSEAVDVFGPPSRTLTLRASPLPTNQTRVSTSEGSSTSAVVVHIEDTTEIQRAEVARRDMVTNISHELRTPIGAVALLAETLTAEDDPATMRHLAGRIELETERLTATLQDVLALSRLEASGPADRSETDMAELVKACCAKLRPSAERAGIELTIGRLDDRLTILADPALIKRAIENLLENAIKYSDKGEPVLVEAVAVDCPEGEFAAVSVKDTGIGIPLRERKRIFERFYRVDRARGRDTGGSGLGLAIVRHVAVSHDGHVDVDSLEGVGSTFTLRIPLVSDPRGSADTPPTRFQALEPDPSAAMSSMPVAVRPLNPIDPAHQRISSN